MIGKIRELLSLMDRKQKIMSGLVLLVNFVSSIAGLAGIASILPFISILSDPDAVFNNSYINSVYEFLHYSSRNLFIMHAGVAILCVFLLSNGIVAFSTWFNIFYAEQINYKLTVTLLSKYLNNSYEFFLGRNSSELIKNIFTEITSVITNIIRPLVEIISSVFLTFSIMLFLIILNPLSTVIILASLSVVYSLIFYIIRNKLGAASKLKVAMNRERYKTAYEAFGGIKDIKLIHREKLFLDNFCVAERKLKKSIVMVTVLSQLPKYLLETIAFGSILLVALILFINNTSFMDVIPLLALYAFAGYRLMPALQIVYRGATSIKANMSSIDVLLHELKAAGFEGVGAELKVRGPVPFDTMISLNNVSFSYHGTDKVILDRISLNIPKNSMVALIGTTGCGKTTLVDVILGLLDPDAGIISVDSVAITAENRHSWQNRLGYVPQQIFLTDDTVARNIAFAVEDDAIDMKRVVEAARIANIHETIMQDLSDGYNTVVGERGVRLSGGQRQRIGIARALYRNPDVLVFDEATSALDSMTEAAVMDAINKLMGDKTIIIIAHRLSTVKKCDCIYQLDKGRISASGTFEELELKSPDFRSAIQST